MNQWFLATLLENLQAIKHHQTSFKFQSDWEKIVFVLASDSTGRLVDYADFSILWFK